MPGPGGSGIRGGGPGGICPIMCGPGGAPGKTTSASCMSRQITVDTSP